MRSYSETEFNNMSSMQINQNRKVINSVLLKISNEKSIMSPDEIGKKVLLILKEHTKDITSIYDEEKNTFVHILVNEEKLESLTIIVETYYLNLEREAFYAWFTSENTSRLTPLDISAQNGNKEIIKYLFGKIAKTEEKILRLDEKRNSFFHYAAQKNQTFPIIFFSQHLQKYFPNKKIIDNSNEHLITPLHYACFHKSLKAIDLFLDLGADINARDCNEKSVLIYAVCSGSSRAVKKLLLRGADKHLKDDTGKTAYDYAVQNRKNNIAELLKAKSLPQKFFCNALELASIKGVRNDDITAYSLFAYFMFITLYFIDHLPSALLKSQGYDLVSLVFGLIGLSSVFLAFVLFIYFTSFYQREQSHYEVIQEGSSLLELINHSDEVCVKCKRNIPNDTIHCLVCDICVDQWDHHCFWLNTCIDAKVKPKFTLFFFLLLLGALSSFIFGVLEIVILITAPSLTIAWLIVMSLFAAFLLYLLCFILFPLGFCLIAKRKDDIHPMNASAFEDKLISKTLNSSSFNNN